MSKERSPFHRERFTQTLVGQLNLFLRREVKNPTLQLVSFTKVNCSKDLAYATVYWDTFQLDKKDEIAKALSGLKGKMRSYLAQNLKVRHTPALSLEFDAQYEAEVKMTSLLSANNHVYL